MLIYNTRPKRQRMSIWQCPDCKTEYTVAKEAKGVRCGPCSKTRGPKAGVCVRVRIEETLV